MHGYSNLSHSFMTKHIYDMIKIVNPRMYSATKYGWNGILLVFLLGPNGLFDPVWYAAIANGIRKCSVKNHVKVALSKLHNLILTIQYPCMGQLK